VLNIQLALDCICTELGNKKIVEITDLEFVLYKFSLQAPHSHIPYGKVGSGLYTTRNLASYEVVRAAIPLALKEIQSIDMENESVFTIVDYGTADGGSSMPFIYACVKAIREKYGEELPINVIYEDQPVNDFKSVFLRIQGTTLIGFKPFFQSTDRLTIIIVGFGRRMCEQIKYQC
jgi:hypothetical protein